MIAIRDDDLSAWSDVEDIKKIYGDFLECGGKVSFATVPYSVEFFFRGNRHLLYQGTEKKAIEKNEPLIHYLLPYVCNGQVEIMLHGYDHGYYVRTPDGKSFLDKKTREEIGEGADIAFIPECAAKSAEQIKTELEKGRRILENVFDTDVRIFVPPSNFLNAKVSSVIDRFGFNVSGTMTGIHSRKPDKYAMSVFLSKALWHMTKKSISYPKIMIYRNHMELTGYAFTPMTNFRRFNNQLQYCRRNHYGFTLATHYWELLEHEELLTKFRKIIFQCLQANEIVTLSEFFGRQQ